MRTAHGRHISEREAWAARREAASSEYACRINEVKVSDVELIRV